MNSRNPALVLAIAGAGLLLWKGEGSAAAVLGLVGALITLAAAVLVSGRVRQVVGLMGGLLWAGALVAGVTGGSGGLVVAACVLGLIGAGLVAVFGRRWPGWSDRYDRQPADAAQDDPRAMWDKLDRGEDPTGPDGTPGPQ